MITLTALGSAIPRPFELRKTARRRPELAESAHSGRLRVADRQRRTKEEEMGWNSAAVQTWAVTLASLLLGDGWRASTSLAFVWVYIYTEKMDG